MSLCIVYEATAATIDISKNYGIVLFAGNFIASFFLISYIMKRVIGNGIKLYAESRFADKAVKEGIEVIQTLEKAKALLEKIPLEHLDVLLQQINNGGLLSSEIKEVLSLNSFNELTIDLEKGSQQGVFTKKI